MLSASLKKKLQRFSFIAYRGEGGRKEMEWLILFYTRFSYKHCNFSHVCLLVKMTSKTVTRSIGLKGCGVYLSAKFSWTSPLSDQVRSLISPRTEGKETVSKNVLYGQSFC